MFKTCTKCGNKKTIDLFYKQTSSKDGLQHRCKQCSNVDKKKYKSKNYSEQIKQWRKNNPDKIRQYDKKWKSLNKDKHYQTVKAHHKRKYATDPNFKIKANLRTRLFQALKGITKAHNTLELLGCSIEDFKMYTEKLFAEGMSWENYGKWHIDHVIPCAAFDLTQHDQQKQCFYFTNLQPLWSVDNLAKGAKINWKK